MLIVALGERPPADSGAGDGEDGSDSETGEDLEAAVSVGMVRVGGLCRNPQAEQNQAGHQNIGGGFETVGNQSDGMGGKADGNFDGGKCNADADAGQCGPAGGLFQTPHASGYIIESLGHWAAHAAAPRDESAECAEDRTDQGTFEEVLTGGREQIRSADPWPRRAKKDQR